MHSDTSGGTVSGARITPATRTLSGKAVLLVGSVGPLGYLPASGTVTVVVVGLPLYWLSSHVPVVFYISGLVVFVAASIAIHSVGDRILGTKDSRHLVWDELAGFFLAVCGVPFTMQTAIIALCIERLLDITKAFPGKLVERRLPGGWGVVADDLVAGGYTWLIMQGLVHYRPEWIGL